LFAFFAVGLEKGLELRRTLETDYGINDDVEVNKGSKAESGIDVVSTQDAEPEMTKEPKGSRGDATKTTVFT